MRTAAILPVKRFSRAKQRLGANVADPLRLDLARAMVGDVLSALRDCPAIERTIVVTREEAAAAAARYLGGIVVEDLAENGQSAAVARGVERAVAEGFERVLCIPGDCPALDPHELQALLEAKADAPSGSVVIVPDRHGTGTNGLLLTPRGRSPPASGPTAVSATSGSPRPRGSRAGCGGSPRCCSTSTPARISPPCASGWRAGRVGSHPERAAPASYSARGECQPGVPPPPARYG